MAAKSAVWKLPCKDATFLEPSEQPDSGSCPGEQFSNGRTAEDPEKTPQGLSLGGLREVQPSFHKDYAVVSVATSRIYPKCK